MDYFKLTRAFWDFAFENPEKIKPNHCALYLFIVEHCNRLGWKHKFGLPTTMAKDAIGIRSYNTYITTLSELVEFGLIDLIEKSKNQYSSNIVAISNFNKAQDKALDKALIKHSTKQSESTIQSIDSINKQDTIIPINNITKNDLYFNELIDAESWLETCAMQNTNKFNIEEIKQKLLIFKNELNLCLDIKQQKQEFTSHFVRWLNKQQKENINIISQKYNIDGLRKQFTDL